MFDIWDVNGGSWMRVGNLILGLLSGAYRLKSNPNHSMMGQGVTLYHKKIIFLIMCKIHTNLKDTFLQEKKTYWQNVFTEFVDVLKNLFSGQEWICKNFVIL